MCAVRVKKEKHVTSMGQNREPTIRSCDTGQRIPCFESCQLQHECAISFHTTLLPTFLEWIEPNFLSHGATL